MTKVSLAVCRRRCVTGSPFEKEHVKSEVRRWTLRCRDLLARDSYVVTQIDRATGGVLLHVTGSKPVLLPVADVERLRRQLGEAAEIAAEQGRDE